MYTSSMFENKCLKQYDCVTPGSVLTVIVGNVGGGGGSARPKYCYQHDSEILRRYLVRLMLRY